MVFSMPLVGPGRDKSTPSRNIIGCTTSRTLISDRGASTRVCVFLLASSLPWCPPRQYLLVLISLNGQGYVRDSNTISSTNRVPSSPMDPSFMPSCGFHHIQHTPCSASSPPATTSPDPTFSPRSVSCESNDTCPSSFTPFFASSTADKPLDSRHTPVQLPESSVSSLPASTISDAASSSFTLRRRPRPAHCNNGTISTDAGIPDSRFSSLHELLEKAGYKETRVVTPDRQSLAGMFAQKLATPPRKPRLVDDFSSDSPSLAACELRRAYERSTTSRSTPKATSTKSLPSRNYKPPTQNNAPPLPSAPASSSSWFPNIWFFGPGSFSNDASQVAVQGDEPVDIASQQEPLQANVGSSTLASTSASASTSPFSAVTAAKAKRTATVNPVWTASVAYRSAKSHTAPVRKSAAISSQATHSQADAEQAWKELHNRGSNANTKRRPGLIDAFSSPTKQAPHANASQASPSRQRQWRQERAKWRESLGDLQAMMDQSRLRREIAAAAAAATTETETAKAIETDCTNGSGMDDDTSAAVAAGEAVFAARAAQTHNDAMAKFVSGPALPFLSTDPAVAPRNASCTTPAHLSMRRIKSVEVLSKIMRERRTISTASSSCNALDTTWHDTPSSIGIDVQDGRISPTIKKRCTPPRLTVSSPRGISSPKELELEGQEFEPMSWSPGKCGGAIIISNRRVQNKRRSKLRHVSSGADLVSTTTAKGDLKTPSRRARGRDKTLANTSPGESGGARVAVAALIRNSVGSLSRGSTARAFKDDFHVLDDAEREVALQAGGVLDSPTRQRCSNPEHSVLALSSIHNTRAASERTDVFRSSTTLTLSKKDFSARITRTSKIMRLIDEAENVPSIASMISQPVVASRSSSASGPAVAQPITSPKPSPANSRTHIAQGLSSSLSKNSRDRMHTITRVLGQKQPLSS